MVCLACGGSLASSSQHLYLISFTSTEQNSSALVKACMARSMIGTIANSTASETDYSLRAWTAVCHWASLPHDHLRRSRCIGHSVASTVRWYPLEAPHHLGFYHHLQTRRSPHPLLPPSLFTRDVSEPVWELFSVSFSHLAAAGVSRLFHVP